MALPVIFRLFVGLGSEVAEKLVESAPYGRGSESALRKINRLSRRDHRGRSGWSTHSWMVNQQSEGIDRRYRTLPEFG
jgi:hypothetical protein